MKIKLLDEALILDILDDNIYCIVWQQAGDETIKYGSYLYDCDRRLVDEILGSVDCSAFLSNLCRLQMLGGVITLQYPNREFQMLFLLYMQVLRQLYCFIIREPLAIVTDVQKLIQEQIEKTQIQPFFADILQPQRIAENIQLMVDDYVKQFGDDERLHQLFSTE